MDLSALDKIELAVSDSLKASTFENIQTSVGRVQVLHWKASDISATHIPNAWRNSPIVHLAPLCRELDIEIIDAFPDAVHRGHTPGMDAGLGSNRPGHLRGVEGC